MHKYLLGLSLLLAGCRTAAVDTPFSYGMTETQILHGLTPMQICLDQSAGYQPAIDFIQKYKIDCADIMRQALDTSIKLSSNTKLCRHYNDAEMPELRQEYLKEIQARGLNCDSLLMIDAQRRQAAAINAPRTTWCDPSGYCTTY